MLLKPILPDIMIPEFACLCQAMSVRVDYVTHLIRISLSRVTLETKPLGLRDP